MANSLRTIFFKQFQNCLTKVICHYKNVAVRSPLRRGTHGRHMKPFQFEQNDNNYLIVNEKYWTIYVFDSSVSRAKNLCSSDENFKQLNILKTNRERKHPKISDESIEPELCFSRKMYNILNGDDGIMLIYSFS